jgi:hypothetical protein
MELWGLRDKCVISKKILRIKFRIHDVSIALYTNSKLIYKLVTDQLYFYRTRSNSKHYIKFYLEYLPKLEPVIGVFPSRVHKGNYLFKYFLHTVDLSIQILANPRTNKVKGYITRFHNFTKEELFYQIFFQPLSFILKHRNLFFIHASALVKGEGGILIVGPADSGKSTIAISLVREGFRLLADDSPLLTSENSNIKALSFIEKVKIKSKLISFFPELNSLIAKQNGTKLRVSFCAEKFYKRAIAQTCIPRLIIFPQCINKGKIKTQPISKKEALTNLLKDDNFIYYDKKGTIKDIPKRHFKILSDLVRQAKAYRLYYREKDIPKLAAIIRDCLRE